LAEIAVLQARRDELAAEIQQITTEAEQEGLRGIRRLLEDSGLPRFACGASFQQLLLGIDLAQRRQLIEDRRELLQRAMELGPRSAERGHDRGADERAAFVSAIRRR
jgi:hypothetical protein